MVGPLRGKKIFYDFSRRLGSRGNLNTKTQISVERSYVVEGIEKMSPARPMVRIDRSMERKKEDENDTPFLLQFNTSSGRLSCPLPITPPPTIVVA